MMTNVTSIKTLLTHTLLLVLKMRNKLGNKFTPFERLEVTAFLRLIIDNQSSEAHIDE